MKTYITAIATAGILSCGAAFTAGSAAQAGNGTAGVCSRRALQHELTGTARSQYVRKCRVGLSRAYFAFNQNRAAKNADLGG